MKKYIGVAIVGLLLSTPVFAQVFDQPQTPTIPPVMTEQQIMVSNEISQMWQQLFILEESKTIDPIFLQIISQSLDQFEMDQGIQG